MDFLTLFLILVFFHFLFDYPLQGDFLSKAKNMVAPIPGVPWYQAMGAHCFMHAFAVWFMSGMIALFVLEFVTHWITDCLKCKGIIDFNVDQAIHIIMKAIYAFILVGSTNVLA